MLLFTESVQANESLLMIQNVSVHTQITGGVFLFLLISLLA